MAKVGMEYVVSAILTEGEDGSPSYSAGKHWGPASTFNLTTNSNNITDYGDDGAVESDKTLSTLGVSVELNESTLELEAELLGHSIDESTGEMDVTTEDVAPWIGLGCCGKSRRNNETVVRAIWVWKAQLSNPNDENSTKQESTSFNHTTYEGTAYPLLDGNHKLVAKKEFTGETALSDAKAWINAKAGIVASGS